MRPEKSGREPRWIFARFRLNAPKALALAMPVHTPGSGSDGVTVSPSLPIVAIAGAIADFW
jgi:hypothetical protein